MTEGRLLPEKEALRRALRWLAEQEAIDRDAIDAAVLRFDLPPADHEWLIATLLAPSEAGKPRAE